MSSHVPAAAVFLSVGFVMSSMTVETTVMKKDVVSLLGLKKTVWNLKR